MLELKNISKYYNAGTVNEMCLFNDFNLSIDLFPLSAATDPVKLPC